MHCEYASLFKKQDMNMITQRKGIGILDGEDGITAIEYSLIAMLIAILIISALGVLGGSLESIYNRLGLIW